METQSVQFGELNCIVVGGEEPSLPTIVMCHGFGAPGTDLVGLAPYLSTVPARFVFPAAPLTLPSMWGGDSRAWWMIDMNRFEQRLSSGQFDLSDEVPDGLSRAHELLTGAIGEMMKGSSGPLVLGGFSQGSMLALDVALGSEVELAGLVLFSSTLVARSRWNEKRAGGMEIFQSHGRRDPILAFSAAERQRDTLKELGANVVWESFNGGHEIPLPVLNGAKTFLEKILS